MIGTERVPCEPCGGSGEVPLIDPPTPDTIFFTCGVCHGSGDAIFEPEEEVD